MLKVNKKKSEPEDYFEYDIKTGKIIPIFKEGNRHEKAKYTIDLLNLNDNRLCKIRKVFIINYTKNIETRKYLSNFPSLRRYLEDSL